MPLASSACACLRPSRRPVLSRSWPRTSSASQACWTPPAWPSPDACEARAAAPCCPCIASRARFFCRSQTSESGARNEIILTRPGREEDTLDALGLQPRAGPPPWPRPTGRFVPAFWAANPELNQPCAGRKRTRAPPSATAAGAPFPDGAAASSAAASAADFTGNWTAAAVARAPPIRPRKVRFARGSARRAWPAPSQPGGSEPGRGATAGGSSGCAGRSG